MSLPGKYYDTRKEVKDALIISSTQFKHLWKAGKIKVITPKSGLDDNATVKQ